MRDGGSRRSGFLTAHSALERTPSSLAWTIPVALLAIGAVILANLAGRSNARLHPVWMLVVAGVSAVWIGLVFWKFPRRKESKSEASPFQDIFDSTGPMVIAIGLDGNLLQLNPAAERLLGFHASELVGTPRTGEILAEAEGPRLIAELQRLNGLEPDPDMTPHERLETLMTTVGMLPPSQSPTFEAHFRRKDGEIFPATIQISALRNAEGDMRGLLVVGLDRSAILNQEQAAARESQERYRDLFENSNEMIATLSTEGRFLYANPAWKRCFGLNSSLLVGLNSFEEVFGANCTGEVAALFRRALDGESIDGAPLRNLTPDGRMLELELSLSQRRRAGHPLAVRCLLRDVTQQRQREQRLTLQLVVSQIVGENITPQEAATRILEALCISQSWDVGLKWEINEEESRLEYCAAWGSPGEGTGELIHESMGQTLALGTEMPGRVWLEGRPVWIGDLAAVPASPRFENALRHTMGSGWAVPVRAGNRTMAVLEFYSRLRLREDVEALATIETVAASLGQMLARSRERGRAEELYRQQEILLNSVADAICGIDRHGSVTFANPAAVRLLGTPAFQLTGKPVHELLHGAVAGIRNCNEDCALLRATTRQVASAGEDAIYKADKTSIPIEYFFTPIMDHGKFSGSVLSFRDISQRYALDRLKDEFISTVSHELRTPLTSIRGALGLLSSGILGQINEKAANLLRIAASNSDRLVRLINDILDLERIQSGREPIAFRGLHLSEVVRQAIDGMQPVADAAGVQLLHDTTQAKITGDPDRLLQVLTNLLSNAIKFSPPNSTVSIMIRPGASGVTLSVIDQGRGIPADKLEAVFGRFQQVDASDSRQKGGSGLGLAICRTIVTQHSGRIWAERNSVRGSTFRVFLPYKPAGVAVPLPAGAAGQGTVLLADSNRLSRPLIVEKLARHGYNVIETTTIEQTLAAALDGVEAILLDTALDGMNGWEILPLLRQNDPDGHVPIVLLSLASANVQLPLQAKGWVPKPVEEDALLTELARVLCGPGENARILIVEDDEDLAKVISVVFSRESIEVRTVHTREGAMDGCLTFEPHLVLLDIGLPDGDGFNVVDWLRQHETFARLPLVVYSGRELNEEERRQLTLGPTHFLTKARVQPQQLEALVLTLLRKSRQMDEAPYIASARPEATATGSV